jgi:hypothetical protein
MGDNIPICDISLSISWALLAQDVERLEGGKKGNEGEDHKVKKKKINGGSKNII